MQCCSRAFITLHYIFFNMLSQSLVVRDRLVKKSKSQSDLPIIIFSFDKDIYGRRNKHNHVTHYHCDNH